MSENASVSTFESGLNIDSSPIRQPKGTYRYAQNSVIETFDGNFLDLSSEESNAICSELQDGDVIKGAILLDNNDRLLFIYNRNQLKGRISIESKDCGLTDIISSTCFGWNDTNRIQAVFRLFKGCERVVYFTDGVNPIYTINIDSLADYLPDSVISNNSLGSTQDKIDYTEQNNLWDCNKIRYRRFYDFPNINVESINDQGGQLEVGTYQFAVRYLDNDLNPTSWMFITNPVPIVNESTISPYHSIDGGIAGVGEDNSISGEESLPPTTKSISLRLNQLDSTYSYYQIAVLQSSDTIGLSSQIYIKPEVPITSSSDIYEFVGKNSTEDIASTIEEILQPQPDIETAKHIAQIDNRLLISNVKGKTYNWAAFQRKASQIGSKYVVKQVPKYQYNTSVKGHDYYWNSRGYMRDEVYAFAIVYVFNDGTESPAFHIPGRPVNWDPVNNTQLPDQWDSRIIKPGTSSAPVDEQNYDHLPENLQNEHARWVSENTAVKLDETSGIMSYYSVGDKYPDIKDCNGDSIWGTDIKGDSLAGKNIRHHKFPTAALEKIQDLNNTYSMGVEFFNIEIPSEYSNDIQGYYIVRAKRTDVNKTVFDKGIIDNTKTMAADEYYYLKSSTSLDNDTTPYDSERMFVYHSPKVFFNRDFPSANYMSIEGIYSEDSFRNTSLTNYYSSNTDRNSEIIAYLLWDEFNSNQTQLYARLVQQGQYCDRVQSQVKDGPVQSVRVNFDTGDYFLNHLGSIHMYVFWTASDIDNAGPNMYYAAYKQYRDVYSNLFALRYIKTHSNIESPSESSKTVFGGDIFISKLDWTLQDFDRSRTYMSAYIESEINSELRHEGDGGVCNSLFKGRYFYSTDLSNSNGESSDYNVVDVLDRLSMDIDDYIFRYHNTADPDYKAADVTPNDYICPDYLAVNRDYLIQNYQKEYISIPLTFDYCSKCINDYPYRIYYSVKSFQEETTDNYRSILVNNYNDLMGDQGPITNMFIDKDRLFLHANKALWSIQTRPNQVVSNESTIFIGAGEFLSIPPRKLVTTDYGYGGSNQKWSTVTTEHGTFFCDSNLGKVFLLSQGLGEISANGMSSWFEENLAIRFTEEFKSLFGFDFPNIDALNQTSIGIIGVYDTRYKRYIVHKKDFVFTQLGRESIIGYGTSIRDKTVDVSKIGKSGKGIYFNTFDNKFYEVSLKDFYQSRPLDFRNKDYFENESWTLSYNAITKTWVSFHSYMPNYMYSTESSFVSFVDGIPNTWKHNSRGRILTFYGTRYNMVVEYVDAGSNGGEKIFGSIKYISRCNKYDYDHEQHVELSNDTFDSFYAYTRDQITSTNQILLKNDNPYSTITDNRTASRAVRVDNAFRVSKNVKDIAISRNSQPLLTKDWSDINYSSAFNEDGFNNGFIDKVPNELARDVNKSVYERARIKDKYMIVRLFFKPDEDIRMTLQLSSTFNFSKNR